LEELHQLLWEQYSFFASFAAVLDVANVAVVDLVQALKDRLTSVMFE
jgi:hypothetical protein